VRRTLDANPKYSGAHTCPVCGRNSHWICVSESPVVIRVICDGPCGTFETAYTELETFPFFEGAVHKLAFH
jgi:transcription elongation factor Elf1